MDGAALPGCVVSVTDAARPNTFAPLAHAPVANDAPHGISQSRLAVLDATMKQYVADQKLAGAVVMIHQDGREVFSEAYGWPRELFSFAMAMQNLLWGVATPMAGAIADRYGAARVLMTGAVFYCIGTVVMAYAAAPLLFNIGGGVLVGIGIAMSSFGIVMAALGRIVPPERRSWAFGIATASGSLGQFVFAPMSGALIAAYGWHNALLILAASTLFIIIFAVPLMAQNSSGGLRSYASPL